MHTSALVQSRLRCPGWKHRKHKPRISGADAPQPEAPVSFLVSIRRVQSLPFEGFGNSQTSLSCNLALPSSGSISLVSGRGATLPPDDAEEMPSPETWSCRRTDADETDSGLPSGTQRCENPGGCEAVESMTGKRRRRWSA
jgi:hypothetical protein